MSDAEMAELADYLPDPEVISEPLTVEQVRETLTDGIVVGVWRVTHDDAHVLSGRVRLSDEESPWLASIEPKSELSYTLSDAADCTVVDDRKRDYGPPIDVMDSDSDRDVYHTNPGFSPNDDGTVELLQPDPVYNSKGILYYAPQPIGTVSHIETYPARGPLEDHSVGYDGPWWWWNTSRIQGVNDDE